MLSTSSDIKEVVSKSNDGCPDNQLTRNKQVVLILVKQCIRTSKRGITPEESAERIGPPKGKTVEVVFENMIRINEVNESIIK
jgi:hypothetical protein